MELRRASSVAGLEAVPIHGGGRRSCRSFARDSSRPRSSSTSAGSYRAGSPARRSAPERHSPSSRLTRRSPRRSARRVGSLRARRFATSARSPATCCSRRAAGTGGSSGPAGSMEATSASPDDGEHREHAVFANDFCASAHPSDAAAALLALDATLLTTGGRLGIAELYRVPNDDDRRTTTLEHGELIARGRAAAVRALRLPEGDGAQALRRSRWSESPRRVPGDDTRRARRRRARRPGCSTSEDSTQRRRCPGTRTSSRSRRHS